MRLKPIVIPLVVFVASFIGVLITACDDNNKGGSEDDDGEPRRTVWEGEIDLSESSGEIAV